MAVPKCIRCDGTRWVCEAHDDQPWGISADACTCGAPGMPCPDCNAGEPPRPPPGFKTARSLQVAHWRLDCDSGSLRPQCDRCGTTGCVCEAHPSHGTAARARDHPTR